ncbi:MAG TPA: D-amino acid aminotransferase [Gammaproteobacteria bacterium]|nr:D-amino acid aminotransferase [Gammaproteobacteria bacterium]
MSTAYFKGEFMPLDAVRVSPLDRGYLLGDGVYEVVPVYAGRLFCIDAHLDRLERSLSSIAIKNPWSRSAWVKMLDGLVERNGGGEQSLYFQVTRGEAPRDHAFPEGIRPLIFAMSRPGPRRTSPQPIHAVTRVDNRWGRCDIKAIALLPNVLLRQEAVSAQAGEAILVRDGSVTEGAASNVFVIAGGVVRTPPKSPKILAGITRDVTLELAAAAGIRCEECDVAEAALPSADEIWVTSSSLEITPVARLDGRPVGSGAPGPVWQTVFDRFIEFKRELARVPGETIA